MLACMAAQEAIAQNLANASTTGYKQDVPRYESFQSMLLDRLSGAASTQTGALGSGVSVDSLTTDFTQGSLQSTGNPLDVAMTGHAFLTVNTPAGIEYSRDGAMTRDPNGKLVQSVSNDPVLDDAGQPITIPVNVKTISIGSDGTITADGTTVAKKLGLVDLDPANAVKVGGNCYTASSTAKPTSEDTVRQGYLETSNVNTVQAMVAMIAAQRNYETCAKMLQSEDEVTGKATSTVAILS